MDGRGVFRGGAQNAYHNHKSSCHPRTGKTHAVSRAELMRFNEGKSKGCSGIKIGNADSDLLTCDICNGDEREKSGRPGGGPAAQTSCVGYGLGRTEKLIYGRAWMDGWRGVEGCKRISLARPLIPLRPIAAEGGPLGTIPTDYMYDGRHSDIILS